MKFFVINILVFMFCLSSYATSMIVHTNSGDHVFELSDIMSITFDDGVQNPASMISIEGGIFEMGDRLGNGGTNELPLHEVFVNSFEIAQFEVTHQEFIEFLNSYEVEPSGIYHGVELIDLDDPDCAISHNGNFFYFLGTNATSTLNCPVVEITWYGSLVYCNWKSEQENLEPCYDLANWNCDFSRNGYRLPTEAEWEYAARGGVYETDNYEFSGTTEELAEFAWYDANSSNHNHNIGSRQPNQLGINDMSGNDWEWCWDIYDYEYYDNSPKDNPHGPTYGESRILRGGSWFYTSNECRVSYRRGGNPSGSGKGISFRIVKNDEDN